MEVIISNPEEFGEELLNRDYYISKIDGKTINNWENVKN